MENTATESQTSAPRVVNVVPQTPREVAVRFEARGFDGSPRVAAACIYVDELETLSLESLLQTILLRAHIEEGGVRCGLEPIVEVRAYASKDGAEAMTRIATAGVPPSE